MYFANRCEAGRRLAARLERYRDQDPVVLALPRGGVPVGFEIAHALEAPLDVIVARKIGAPWQPELAIGAIAPGAKVVDEDLVRLFHVDPDYIEAATGREWRVIDERLAEYRQDRQPAEVRDRTVIVVDDGIATGATVLAAVESVRRQAPRLIVVAAPVCASETVPKVEAKADAVVFLDTPADFRAVGYWYEDFTPTSDDEVRRLLKRSRLEREAHFHPGDPQ